MSWINSIRLSVRTVISFGVAALLLLFCALFMTSKINDYSTSTNRSLTGELEELRNYEDLYAFLVQAESAEDDVLMGVTTADARYRNTADGFSRRLDDLRNQPERVDANTLQEVSTMWSGIQQAQERIQSTHSLRRIAARASMPANLRGQYSSLESRLYSLAKFQEDRISQSGTQQLSAAGRLEEEIWLVLALMGVIVVAGGFICYRTLIVPLGTFVHVTKRISAGKFGSQVNIKSRDEFGQLAESFNVMSTDIAKLFAYLNEVGNPVYAVDREFTVQFANSAAVRLAGVQYDDIVEKKKCHEVFKLPLCGTVDCPVSRAWSERRTIAGESLVRLDNKETPVLYQASSITDLDGNAIRGVEVLTDIAELKEFTNKLEVQRLYLSRSVNDLLGKMNRLADGDLTVSMAVESDDEIGQLFRGFNDAVSNFRAILAEVIQSVRSTAGASSEISTSAEVLASGASEQSTQAGEVAAAVEEMTRTVIDNARNASTAVEAVMQNGKVAQNGGEVVQRAVYKIREIAEVVRKSSSTVDQLGRLSAEIGEIISVIDDIADQTNLLALNAAIEAARAGEEGRGFAVVADEVRKLAERTSQATKQIASMIKNIQQGTKEAVDTMKHGNDEVTEGIMLADQANESLKNVVSNAQKIIDIINQIAAASEEQSSASEQISKNVETISNVSTESATGISQIARAADNLNELTGNLRNLTERLKVEPSNDVAVSSSKERT